MVPSPRRARLRVGVASLALAAALGGGCASGPDPIHSLGEEARLTRATVIELGRATEELRREVTDLRTRVVAARREIEAAAREDASRHEDGLRRLDALGARLMAAERRIGELDARMAGTQRGVDALGSRLAGVEQRVGALGTTVGGLEATVNGLADQVARLESLPPTTGSPPDVTRPRSAPRPPPAELSPDELFQRGTRALRNGELGQAILDFEDFLRRHASHPLAGEAQFWIGEAYFAARDYQHAIAEYQKALDRAPTGDKSAETLYRLGLAYRSLKRPEAAREAWTQLLRDFPQSEAARKARSALREGATAPRPDAAIPR